MSFRRRRRWLRRLALGLVVVTAASAGHAAAAPPRDAARPDDVAARFAHSDVAAPPVLAGGAEWTFERRDALILVVGSVALALGLAFALGYLRRPRLAGL